MNKIKYLLFTFIMVFFASSNVFANSMKKLDVYVTLNKDGSGDVKEVWDVTSDSGTELYKPITNLGNSEFSSFKVKMDGEEFAYQDKWKVDASKDWKAYKNGINKTSDGIELCFGISDYGHHVYTLTYHVTNMVYTTEDAQVLYWKLINDSMKPTPDRVSVTVEGPTAYSDELPVWGFGYKGYAYVYDGKIYMSNSENSYFYSSQYVVLLAKYPLGTFDTTNSLKKFQTFNDFYQQAMDGAYSNGELTSDEIFEIIAVIFVFFMSFIFPFLMVFLAAKPKNDYIKNKINEKDVNPFRDIPCNKDILDAYFLSSVYNISKKREDLIGACILKWVLEGQVKVSESESKVLHKKVISIDMTKEYNEEGLLKDMYDMLYKASSDGILEDNEMKKWSTKNYSKIYSWFDKVLDYSRDKYVDEGKINKISKGHVFISYKYEITPSLEEEALHLIGLKKFLKEFSEIDEKETIEVKMWEYYLIYAQIFGMAKQVANQMKKLYPEIKMQLDGRNIDITDIVLINSFSNNMVTAASTARSRAQSYSSGGGGSSFSGGGGGSFGGGSGGGIR